MSTSLLAAHPQLGGTLADAGGVSPQKARLLDAIVRVVAEKGYTAATVADVVRVAGVSRSTFYELETGKEACFIDAFRHGVDVLDERVGVAVRGAHADGWRAELRAGIRAYLETLAAEPLFARAYLVEIHAAGAAALDARADGLRRFADRYAASARRAHGEDARRPAPDPEALLVLCAGTEQLVAERIRAGGAHDLSELEDVFCACAESVLLGPDRTA
jgi:AcrR family transcriptional regulator